MFRTRANESYVFGNDLHFEGNNRVICDSLAGDVREQVAMG